MADRGRWRAPPARTASGPAFLGAGAGPNQCPAAGRRIFLKWVRVDPGRRVVAARLPDAAAVRVSAMAPGDRPPEWTTRSRTAAR
ncbi:hypothetical protein [Streptosporangium sp. NPDC003464]